MKVTVIGLTTLKWFLNSHTLTCRCCSILSLIATYTSLRITCYQIVIYNIMALCWRFHCLNFWFLFLCYGNQFLALWTLIKQVLNFFFFFVLCCNHCTELEKLKTKKKSSCNFPNVNTFTLALKPLCETRDKWMWGIFSDFLICVDVRIVCSVDLNYFFPDWYMEYFNFFVPFCPMLHSYQGGLVQWLHKSWAP